MGDVIFCISAYNEEWIIEKCLESIKPFADRIIIVEGRFLGFPGPPHSTDNTVEIARRYTNEIIEDVQDLPQHEQRSLYFQGKPGDVYVIIDADWELDGDFFKEYFWESDADVWHIYGYTPVAERSQLFPLAFRHVPGIHHGVGNLPYDCRDKPMLESPYKNDRVEHFYFTRHCIERDDKRMKDKDHYFKTMGAVNHDRVLHRK